jgi:UDP-glucose 4-epimerase
MRVLVTGGAGFVGSHLVDRLVDDGHDVTVYDNLSTGRREFLASHLRRGRVRLIEDDLLRFESVCEAVGGQEMVWHLAANSDVRRGVEHTDVDLQQNTMATYNVLEAMRRGGVAKIAFSSTSTVYGEPTVIPTPEDYGPLCPISLYGAGKLACEGLLSAFSHSFGFRVWIFRFANVIGSRGTHGILVDFFRKLKGSPNELEVLGDGNQRKSYMLVEDTVDAMVYIVQHAGEPVNLYNLGVGDNLLIRRIAEIFLEETGNSGVKCRYTGGARGWVGDVPVMMLAPDKLNALGWKAKSTSEEAVRRAVRALAEERKP